MSLRRLHGICGLIVGPLLAVTALGGGLLAAADEAGFGGYRFRRFLKHLHNYEVLTLWLGVAVAGGLLFMAVSGWALWWQGHLRRRRARRRTN
jgi:uncharacterized iron-regulated membrane protein